MRLPRLEPLLPNVERLLPYFVRLRATADRNRALLAPLAVGLCLTVASPTATAYQDMRSMISGLETGSDRWTTFVERSVAGSVHQAEMPFIDKSIRTGAVSGAGVEISGIGSVAFRAKGGFRGTTPDEARINRSEKQGRIAHTVPVAPPKFFNAGSIFEQKASLLGSPSEYVMAFVKPDIKGKEVQIASTFFVNQSDKAASVLPPMVAELVNNDKADILATAFAPAEPNYAKESPFASILKDENDGRFIPPVMDDDHPWARVPLPPSVFSEREQQCLAAGIYFEARGESVKGQAAVAQVILNRVRNPAYPNTICGVVYQNDNWRNRCQFSFACDGIRDRVKSKSHYRIAEEVALAVTAGKIWLPEVGTSTHYHATYVHPRWAGAMEKMKKIGRHIFYRTHGGGWN